MGEVYRATDTSLKRAVAIKVVSAALALDQERITRLQREAQVLASLNHPNIAAVYGLEQSAGVTGLVMELVEGPTLADRIERGALPLPEVRAIGAQIADALEAAHQQGVIHRDLKPANIKNSASGVRIARADRSRPALLPSPPIVASGQNGRLSPDGKWISYQASLGNTPVAGVYIEAFPSGGQRVEVAKNATLGVWAADGKALYYASDNVLFRVDISESAGSLRLGTPRALMPIFQGRGFSFDVAKDGGILALVTSDRRASRPLTLVQNWIAALGNK